MTSPGLPLVNQHGINPEPDMWAFQIETPDASTATVNSPSIMIDYVHPGTLHDHAIDEYKEHVYFIPYFLTTSLSFVNPCRLGCRIP